MLTAERLRELLDYDPETGVFIWKHRTGYHGPVRAGMVAGADNGEGYWKIGVDGTTYHSSRLAWLYVNGEWPKKEIDHINGNPSDNRLVNLREADRAGNCRNTKSKNNKLGLKGVHAYRSRFIAQICIDGRKKHLGVFDTPEEAYSAYCVSAKQHFGEFARL